MTGLASVAVAPEARGTGVSTGLLRAVLRELRDEGAAISTLFPTTWPVYRKVGYEVAGSQYEVRVRPIDIHVSNRSEPRPPWREDGDRSLRPTVLTAADHAEVTRLYGDVAPHCPGWLDRPGYVWKRIMEPFQGQFMGFRLGDEGYLAGALQRSGTEYTAHLSDVQARTDTAANGLLKLLADLRSTVETVTWYPGGLDALLLRLPDKAFDLRVRRHCMVRIINVVAALQSRGYPAGLRADLSCEVHGDDVIPENNARFTLRVADGQGTVEAGGNGDLRVTHRALSPLFTGFLSPWQLQSVGVLDADPPALATAASIFGSATPTLIDFF